MADLLIHSLSEFRELIEAALTLVQPEHIVEVGSEAGTTTELLADWVVARGAQLTTIDPLPSERVRALAARSPDRHRLLAQRSPAALEGLAPAQLYLLDGDHNYWTVLHELLRIRDTTSAAGVTPVVLLHDVGWPCARRDQYYDPSALPKEFVHPHTFDLGVHPEHAEPIEGGFVSNGHYARALVEGGPRNGVLTAVEDFLAETPGWELHVVPAVFGLGVAFPSSHARAPELREALRGYEKNPLMARLEANRLRNWVEVLMLIRREQAIVAGFERDRAALTTERDAARGEREAVTAERESLRVENASLAQRLADAEAALQETRTRHDALAARWYAKAGDWLDRRGRSRAR